MTATLEDLHDQIGRQLPTEEPNRARDVLELFAGIMTKFYIANGILTSAPQLLARSEDYEGFTSDNCDLMADMQNGSFYWNSRNDIISWLVGTYFSDARRVLDIGCGTGFVTSAMQKTLPGAAFYGADAFPRGLEYSTQSVGGKVFLLHMDARDIPFESEFDLITSFDVLEHIETDDEVIEQTYRALRPKGGVVHVVPQHPALWSPLDEVACHYRRYERNELQQKLKQAGFSILFDSSFMFFLLPLFALSRWKHRVLNERDPTGEYNIPRWLSAAFASVMSAELFLTKQGARWPIGVSRVVAATKD